jgi:hypothetical protein
MAQLSDHEGRRVELPHRLTATLSGFLADPNGENELKTYSGTSP